MSWLWLALLTGPSLASELPVAESDTYALGSDAAVATESWWVSFGNPELGSLIDEGIAHNTDLSGAVARFQQADGAFWQTRSALLPSISFDLASAHQPQSNLAFSPPGVDPDAPQHSAQFGLRGAWEVDLFGRNAMSTRASRYDKLAAAGDRDATALTISTMVGEAYYDLTLNEQRLAILQEQLETNRKLLELVELRRDAAGAATADVLQQRQQVAVLEATLPSAEAGVDLARFRLSVLLGRDELTAQDVTASELPVLGALPETGVPIDLLDNRPDLRAASGRSTSANARQTVAYLGFLPSLQVGGQLGWSAFWYGDSSIDPNKAWQVTTSVSVPIFQGGRRHGAVKAARGAEYGAAEGYRGAVLTALQEVEGALLQDRAATARLEASAQSHDLAKSAYERAREGWLEGVASYLTVFTNLGAWQRAELDLLDARRQAVSARIQLHDALGGEWTRDLGARKAQ
ncbi:MAG: TolC family protein [Proteobacteria bacterium]|nr:TolC family protein [Pseudomonadota bacterium]